MQAYRSNKNSLLVVVGDCQQRLPSCDGLIELEVRRECLLSDQVLQEWLEAAQSNFERKNGPFVWGVLDQKCWWEALYGALACEERREDLQGLIIVGLCLDDTQLFLGRGAPAKERGDIYQNRREKI